MDSTKQKGLAMLAKGMATSEIAKILRVSQRTVQRWATSEGVGNPVIDVCEQVVTRVAIKVEAAVGDELKAQALKLLRLSGKALDCIEEILDSTDTRTADKLKACEIIGDWSGFEGISRGDLLSNVLTKHGLEIAVTPQGEKTLQEKVILENKPLTSFRLSGFCYSDFLASL
ncbi:MAG TPA: helix-turn-helix domain-containing protein [Stenomitos sp.]